jgi:hypothetical protein
MTDNRKNAGGRTIELRTALLLVAFLFGAYFVWERYSSAPKPVSISSTPVTTAQTGTSSPSPTSMPVTTTAQTGIGSPSPTKQYTDVVRYMTADGKFGITDDQSKVPPGAKILSLERREIHPEQPNGGVATRPADKRRNDRIRSGLAVAQLEQEQAAQKAQRDAEDAASSSSPSSSDSDRSPCRQTSWGAVVCDPSRSRSVDDLSVHP